MRQIIVSRCHLGAKICVLSLFALLRLIDLLSTSESSRASSRAVSWRKASGSLANLFHLLSRQPQTCSIKMYDSCEHFEVPHFPHPYMGKPWLSATRIRCVILKTFNPARFFFETTRLNRPSR